jgi:N-glycosylase/DNA lyase
MALIIPDRFCAIRSYIEKRYMTDETFRDVYNDYLTYVNAHRFWSHNAKDVAPDRCKEYAQLVSELEKELIQMLKKGSDEAY